MKWFSLFAAALAVAPLAAGCTAEAVSEDEIEASDEAAVKTASEKLQGAWTSADPSTMPGGRGFQAIVFTQRDNVLKFFTDVNTGVLCVRAPCPTFARLDGTAKVTSKRVTLSDPEAKAPGSSFVGTWSWKVQGNNLVLSRGQETYRLVKEVSYCKQPSDCREQNLAQPRCLGQWTCDEANDCAYKCGAVEPATQWLTLSPKQCGTNPWDEAQDSRSEIANVHTYFKAQGIELETAGFAWPTEARVVCMACSCPRGDLLVVKAKSAADAEKLKAQHGFAFAKQGELFGASPVQCGGNAWEAGNQLGDPRSEAKQLGAWAETKGVKLDEVGFAYPGEPRMVCMACQCARGDLAIVSPRTPATAESLSGLGFAPLF